MSEERIVDPNTGGTKGAKLAKFSSIPPDIRWELAEHCGIGERKYPDTGGRPNWQRGYAWNLTVDALHRHIALWESGKEYDDEPCKAHEATGWEDLCNECGTGSSHLICAMWHAMALRWFEKHEKGFDYRDTDEEINIEDIVQDLPSPPEKVTSYVCGCIEGSDGKRVASCGEGTWFNER